MTEHSIIVAVAPDRSQNRSRFARIDLETAMTTSVPASTSVL
jgi:hypothetical protein